MQNRNCFIYSLAGKLCLYSPKLGSSEHTRSGRINLPLYLEFDSPAEVAKYLLGENQTPNLINEAPSEQRKMGGKSLDIKVLKAIRESIGDLNLRVSNENNVYLDRQRKAAVRQKLISSRETIVRIRKHEKILIIK